MSTRDTAPLISVCGTAKAYPEILIMLLKAGAVLTVRDIKGDSLCELLIRSFGTPQISTKGHKAGWKHKPGMVRLLFEAGADIAIINQAGENPIDQVRVQDNGRLPQRLSHSQRRNQYSA